MKKLILLSAAILSFTACQTLKQTETQTVKIDDYHHLPTNVKGIQHQAKVQVGTVIGSTFYLNDASNGYQTFLDMLYYSVNADTVIERGVMWLDTANVRFPALKPSLYPINTNSFVSTIDANGKLSPTSYTALPFKGSSYTPTLAITGNTLTAGGNSITIPGGVTYTAGTGIAISGSTITNTAPNSTVTTTGYGSGTAYALTNTSAKITMGTASPTATLTSPGTYLILSNLTVEYAGLTTLATQTCNFKLRRTNNTATDLPNASTNFGIPIVTLLSLTAGDADIAPIIYTTTNSNDIIEMWGNRGANVSVGSINVGAASIVVIKLY